MEREGRKVVDFVGLGVGRGGRCFLGGLRVRGGSESGVSVSVMLSGSRFSASWRWSLSESLSSESSSEVAANLES